MRRTAALSVLAATVTVALLAPTPATAGDRGGADRGPQHVVQPTLVARATLSADFLAPGPPSGALATRRQRPPGTVRRPGDPGLLRHGRRRGRDLLGVARQRLRHQGELRRLPPAAVPRDAGLADGPRRSRSDRRRGVPLPERPGPPDRLPDRQRDHPGPPADGCGLRRRVGGPRQGRQLLDRRGVRSVPAARRRERASCSRRRCRSSAGSRRRTRTCSRARPRTCGRAAGSRRMAGSRDGRFLYPITEGAFVDDAAAAPPDDLRVRHHHRRLHRPHLGLPDAPGRQRHRRRVPDRQARSCSSSSGTTSRARRR